jgi:spore germination protein
MRQQNQISQVQFFALFVATMVGSGILTLPHQVADIAKQNGWISVFLGGLLMLGSTLLALATAQHYPGDSFEQYIKKVLGSFLGQGALLFVTVYFLASIAIDARIFSETIKIFLLDQTPVEVIILIMLWSSYFVIASGLKGMIYFIEVLFSPTKLALILLLLSTFTGFTWQEIKPIASEIMPIIKAVPVTVYSYSGPVMMSGFIMPFMSYPAKAPRLTIVAVSLVTLLYMMVTILTIGVFSAEELHYIDYPTIMLLRTVEPGGFLERVDALFIIFYISIDFTTLIALHYFAAFSISRQIGLEEQRSVALLIIPCVYVLTLLAPDAPSFFKMAELMGKMVFWYAAVGVPVIWVVARIRRSF